MGEEAPGGGSILVLVVAQMPLSNNVGPKPLVGQVLRQQLALEIRGQEEHQPRAELGYV